MCISLVIRTHYTLFTVFKFSELFNEQTVRHYSPLHSPILSTKRSAIRYGLGLQTTLAQILQKCYLAGIWIGKFVNCVRLQSHAT